MHRYVEFAFKAMGAAQATGEMNSYGGLIYAFDDQNVWF